MYRKAAQSKASEFKQSQENSITLKGSAAIVAEYFGTLFISISICFVARKRVCMCVACITCSYPLSPSSRHHSLVCVMCVAFNCVLSLPSFHFVTTL